MYEHNALGSWSGLTLCLTKVRSSRARCPATALIELWTTLNLIVEVNFLTHRDVFDQNDRYSVGIESLIDTIHLLLPRRKYLTADLLVTYHAQSFFLVWNQLVSIPAQLTIRLVFF